MMRWGQSRLRAAAGAGLLSTMTVLAPTGLLAGCSADHPLNPSFPLTVAEARNDLRRMRAEAKPLERPLVIASGIYDPGFVVGGLSRDLRKLTSDDAPIVSVSFFGAGTFEACRSRLIDAVNSAFPVSDEGDTVEVDVVAVSMGGLVARYAASEAGEDGRRLRMRRLFTIASPHRGARLANLPTLDARVIQMRAGSSFLADLDAALAETDYELLPYSRLGDAIVGPENTAPPGRNPWWVANLPLTFAHLNVSHDPRLLADIARRLRGESPWTRNPAAGLPEAPEGPDEP